MDFNNVCYGRSDDNDFQVAKQHFCSQILPRYLREFEQFLNKWPRRWLIGDELTVADFQFFEYLDHCWLMSNANDEWNVYPRVRSLMHQVRNLPELKDYFKSETFRNMPVNAKMAKFGAKVVTRDDSEHKHSTN
ncbi:unnamed protein product [Adineta steineri]|uniref:GST C-terminal domain-containing protein n=1 Tax=Adineta steineri TaxID=433720 RepID=A0A819PBU2_9BILA|nr:unnamed protein product [Adineta steineri]CAF4010292.1 unnamed protein product [Adineta steineri]